MRQYFLCGLIVFLMFLSFRYFYTEESFYNTSSTSLCSNMHLYESQLSKQTYYYLEVKKNLLELKSPSSEQSNEFKYGMIYRLFEDWNFSTSWLIAKINKECIDDGIEKELLETLSNIRSMTSKIKEVVPNNDESKNNKWGYFTQQFNKWENSFGVFEDMQTSIYVGYPTKEVFGSRIESINENIKDILESLNNSQSP